MDADKDPHPSYGANDSHGTHVAGIIGAETNNGIGMTGIAPKVQIMSIRIMGNNERPYTTTKMIIDAIGFAQANGAKVINEIYFSVGLLRRGSYSHRDLLYDRSSSWIVVQQPVSGSRSITSRFRIPETGMGHSGLRLASGIIKILPFLARYNLLSCSILSDEVEHH